jgi:hypothetical protein
VLDYPSATEATIETLHRSTLPEELRQLGHDVQEVGEGERILSAAIVERFTRNVVGGLDP